jgi:hypothetical protein
MLRSTNMPQFTAEASLGALRGHYRTTGVVSGEYGIVLAAAHAFCDRHNPRCFLDCMQKCDDLGFYCDNNCRCCCSGRPPHCYL